MGTRAFNEWASAVSTKWVAQLESYASYLATYFGDRPFDSPLWHGERTLMGFLALALRQHKDHVLVEFPSHHTKEDVGTDRGLSKWPDLWFGSPGGRASGWIEGKYCDARFSNRGKENASWNWLTRKRGGAQTEVALAETQLKGIKDNWRESSYAKGDWLVLAQFIVANVGAGSWGRWSKAADNHLKVLREQIDSASVFSQCVVRRWVDPRLDSELPRFLKEQNRRNADDLRACPAAFLVLKQIN